MTQLRDCPICHSSAENAGIFMEENIDSSKISSFSFASRKIPEWMCHKLLRCQDCSLVFTPNPPSVTNLARAYHEAAYDSSEEASDAAKCYINAILPVLNSLTHKNLALEIGTGTGIFLELLVDAGFREVIGVEPSISAIEAASKSARSWIRHGIFKEDDFKPESFDLVCCFMTLEHVQDPMNLTKSVYRLLRKGGVFIAVTHDYQSVVNRLLGKRSPIIDIEHMQLFSKQSIRMMFEGASFQNIQIHGFTNKYSLQYWLRLSPFPKILKSYLNPLFNSKGLNSIRLGINVGNIVTIGFRR